MGRYDDLLLQLSMQEINLQFTEFTSETALAIGNTLINLAKEKQVCIAIDISRFNHQLFHYSLDGTSPNNDRWIKGKNKVANLTGHSSYHTEVLLKNREKTFEEVFHLPLLEYLPFGGAFPINIVNVGMVGTITVSGLTSSEDHDLVVEALKKYLADREIL